MEKQMKLYTNMTKPLVLFVLLFALGIGQMWAGNRRIYFDYSLVTMWDDYTNLSGGAGFACVHCWGGNEGAADYTMSVVEGKSYLACCDIDDGWTHMCFYRKGSDGTWWTKTFDYDNFGSKNYFKIKNDSEKDGGIDKYKWDSATRWVPGVCIDGLINVNNPHLQPFTFDDNDGTYEVTLSAHTTYQFCILDGSTRYTVDNNVWSGTIPGYTLGTTGYDIRLATAGAGTYKFEYNKSTHVMKVTYPTVNHPNIDYCYLYKFNDWTHHYLHIYDSESSIEGTTYPGTEIENYFEIGDDKYYYFAPGDYANCQPNDNNDSRKVNPAASTSAGLGKFQKYITDSWGWRTFTVRIQLENEDATSAGTEYQDIAFNSAVLSDITCPSKTHYDFQGYYTGDGGTGTQVIDKDGHWIASVADYTDASKHWIHAGMSTTLYAKWTEHDYAVTLAISPDGTGTTSPASSTTAKYVTASADITATPSTGYSFREWDFSKTDAVNDIYCADGYSSTSNPVRIHAVHDGTLTANFTPNTYTVRFENLGADAGHKGSLDTTATFNDTIHMKGGIEVPSKTNYDFGGYYISTDKGTTLTNIQIIDANGVWVKNVSGYTGEKGSIASWVCAGDTVLYAKWTETAYTITPSVSPVGAGSVNTVTDAHLVTPSSDITATPTKAVWVFDYWTCGTNVGIAGGKGTTDNPVTVTASQNSTITANFKHRYNLLGSKYEEGKGKAEMATGGMPGWTYGSGADFTINSYTADGENATVNLSYTCTLEAGTYIFEIHDRELGESLGRKGDGGGVYVLTDGSSVQLKGGTDKDQSIFFYPQHAGQYTFRITYMTKDGNYYYPTVTIERPHQVYFGTGYAGIDDLSSVTSGTTGGTLTVTANESTLSNADWVNYGADVTYDPSAATGYTFEGFYSSNEYSDRFTQNNPWIHYNVTGDDNVYAKFEEKSTSVTLANDGNGHVTIGGNIETSTTCGVTTTRELTAVPNEGYTFSSWSKSGDDITLSSTSSNPTTLRGQGAGESSGQTVTANFTYRWALKAESAGWGESEFIIGNITTDGSGDVVGYVEITLAANTNYQFKMKDLLTNDIYKNNNAAVQYMTYTNHTGWGFATDYTFNCGITTAGRGTYRFTWNVTDKTMTVTYPASYQVNYGASVGGSVTSVKDDDNNDVPNGGYVRSGGDVTYTATPNDGYTFVGWCNNDSYGEPFTTYNPWSNNSVTATSNAYAKFKSTNFVIYRSGDKDDDPRAALDDVESYAGGTISEIIEFRMKVRELDTWYTLCLPFTVSAVKVWDEADGAYYDIYPYYRSGGKYIAWHYIIRTPKTKTDLPIAEFDDWDDPTEKAFLPSANTPYIIQWHDGYFQDKYVSFFGAADQTIPSFSAGSAPSSDNVVNVHGNNSMQIGSVAGAYLLENDYGSSGAWLRAEDVSAARTILPFECYILVNSPTRARYRAIRPGMATTDTPTGLETIISDDQQANKILINGQIYIIRDNKIYTIYGMEVQQ